jgi:hypothetical protein
MWKNIVAIHSILKKKIIIFNKLNINKIKSANIILKKINEKKGKVKKNYEKVQKEKKKTKKNTL